MRPVFDPSAVHHLKHRGAVDADGHVLEDAGLWDHYIEARYRDRALRMKRDDERAGVSRDRRPAEQAHAAAAIPPRWAAWGRRIWRPSRRIPTRPTPPTCRTAPATPTSALKLLDAEGLDAAVLYPTLGILWEAELDDVELSQAYCRAYNRWIADFCRGSRRPADPDRPSVARRSRGGGGRARARGRRTAAAAPSSCPSPGRTRRTAIPAHDAVFAKAVELDVPIAIHPAFEPVRVALAALRERPSPVAAGRGDGRRRRAPGLHDLLRLRAPSTASRTLKLVLLECGAGWIGYWLDRLDGVGDRDLPRRPRTVEAQAERLLPPPGLDLGRSRRAHPARHDEDLRRRPLLLGVGLSASRPHRRLPAGAGGDGATRSPPAARAGLLGGNVRQAFGF